MPTTYADLIASVKKTTKEVSLDELKRRIEAGEKMTLLARSFACPASPTSGNKMCREYRSRCASVSDGGVSIG